MVPESSAMRGTMSGVASWAIGPATPASPMARSANIRLAALLSWRAARAWAAAARTSEAASPSRSSSVAVARGSSTLPSTLTARRRTSGERCPAYRVSASSVVWSARSTRASPSLPRASSAACRRAGAAPAASTSSSGSTAAAVPELPRVAAASMAAVSSGPTSARRSVSIFSGGSDGAPVALGAALLLLLLLRDGCGVSSDEDGEVAPRAAPPPAVTAASASERTTRFKEKTGPPGCPVASFGARVRVGELDLAAVVGALAQQPELRGGDGLPARLDRHLVVLADVEVGLGEIDARSEDARALLARVLRIAGHELLPLGDVVELHLDLAVVERAGEEGQVLEVPGPLVVALLLDRPDLVDLAVLERADESPRRGEVHRQAILGDDDLPLEDVLWLRGRGRAGERQHRQGENSRKSERGSLVHS